MKKIYESPYFEKVVAERKEKLKNRLLIFPNNDKIYHFEYYWNRPLQCYQCCGCGLKADIIKNDKSGKEFVKHKFLHKETSKHFCKLRKYDETKYTVDVSTRIVENENFKIIKYTQKGISTSKLFIFDPTNKNLCRGYLWDSTNGYYLCIGCTSKNPRVFARLCKNADGIEYLILSKNQHVCDLKEFNPDKYKNDVIIKKPMYKHVECFVNGEKRKYLLIFTDESQKFYYKFTYENGYLPICLKCNQKHLYIQAYILTDKNGNEYISVRDKKHVCTPFEYNENDFEENQIIQPERYKIIKRNWRGKFVEKLVIFDSIDKNLCREYTLQRTSKTKRYKCNECHHKHSTCAIAWVINYGKENEHVELGKTPHKCSLIKFEDPNLSIINLPNFKIIKTAVKFKSGNPKDCLLIYSSLEKKLCYRYYFDVTSKLFVCHECEYKHRKRVTAKIHKNENNEDFVQLNEKKHICKPQSEKDVLKKMPRFFNIQN
uniref:Uncharacterized protein n=1 Tax=Panagrolaimus davidi TaxID=227884 RepID=A0A914QF19_9BILA